MRVALVLALGLIGAGAAAADEGDGTVIKTVDELRFKVPEDWPIERHGSAAGPIPVEEYLAMKFKNLDARLQAMEQQINQLSLRLRVLESPTQAPDLRSGEDAAAAP